MWRSWVAMRKTRAIMRIPAGDADEEDCACGGSCLITETTGDDITTEAGDCLTPET